MTTRELETAARILGLELHVLHASSEREIDAAFATLVQLRAGALVIGADALFNSRSEQLAALTICHGVPAICQFCEFVSASARLSGVPWLWTLEYGYDEDRTRPMAMRRPARGAMAAFGRSWRRE